MFKFIIIFLLVLLLVRLLLRMLLPVILRQVFQNLQKQNEQPRRPEGSVFVETGDAAVKKTKTDDNDGEYIEYEEIR